MLLDPVIRAVPSMSIRIVILGAGSATFSGAVVRDLAITAGLHGAHVVMMDVDESRLGTIARLAERISDELTAGLTVTTTTNRAEALAGADFVINTALVGGHDTVEAERALAERHGFYRGATLHAYRQCLFFLEVARDMERLCPEAWLIQSANPVFEGCTLMHRLTSVKCIGLCHGHYGYRHVARVLGLELEHVTAETHGFNHCVWLTGFRYRGQDAYPILDRWIKNGADRYWAEHHDRDFRDLHLSRAAVHQYRLFGLLGIGDTPRFAGWWYGTDLETRQHWYTADGGFDSELGWAKYLKTRAQRVATIAEAAGDDSRPITETFPPKLSDEQIVPVIDALANDRPGIFQVNVPNRGPVVRGFPEDLVVEVPAVVDGAGVRAVAVSDLPAKVVTGALIPRWLKCETLVNAVVQRDPDFVVQRLLLCHQAQSLEQAEALVDAWLALPTSAAAKAWFSAEPYPRRARCDMPTAATG